MHLDFTAFESGFDNGLGGASNAAADGTLHYVLFGKDGGGAYFEYDDQVHGAVDQVCRIDLHGDRVTFALVDGGSVTVRREVDDGQWHEFLEGIRSVFAPGVVNDAGASGG